jgi:hypothetical protein
MINPNRRLVLDKPFHACNVAQPQVRRPSRRSRIIQPHLAIHASRTGCVLELLCGWSFRDSPRNDGATLHRDAYVRLTRQLDDQPL